MQNVLIKASMSWLRELLSSLSILISSQTDKYSFEMAKLAYTKCSSLSLCTESMIELLLVEESMYEFSSYLIYLPPSIL